MKKNPPVQWQEFSRTVMLQLVLCWPLPRSSSPSGHTSSSGGGGSRLSARRPAWLQRCLGRVLPATGCVLRYSQSSGNGCSTTSSSGTPPITSRPPYWLELNVGSVTPPSPLRFLQGSSDCRVLINLTTAFLPVQVFVLFLEAESTVSAVNMQCIFYVFLLHRASNVKWT